MRTFYISILFLFCCNTILRAQGTFVFVGSYNIDKNTDGIYVYELDTINGNLNIVSSIKNIINPSFLTLSKNGKFIYACTDTRTPKDGSVSSFEFNANTKSLSFINTQKTGGENPVFVTLDISQNILLSANYNDGSISVFPIKNDGTILPVKQFIQYNDSSINKVRQERSHIHAAVFSPDYKYIFLPDLGADKIRSYVFDSSKDQPLITTQNINTTTTLGSGPRHFTFHPNKKFAYCIEELSGSINVYNYLNGKLDSIQRIATHSKKIKHEFSSADIHISPDGKFLYASNRGEENNIAIFSINENGNLKIVGYQSTKGKTPRIFAINSTGKFLIVANQSSGNIVVFKRDFKKGLLKKVENNIKVKNPSCVMIRKYSE